MSSIVIAEQHPSLLVEKIAARWGADLVFTYSRYEVAPPGFQARAPRSAELRVPASDVTSEWIAERLAELGPKEELAWHSRVQCRGVICHVPMVDFIGRPTHSEICDLIRTLTAEIGLNGHLFLFETGRSFHGYFLDVIPEQDWYRYLGHLLLLNGPDRAPVIDARWVGHALERGFTALRWSHNTNRYRAMPRLTSFDSE